MVWGIVLSSLSALLALGLALVYRSHRVINFAQADLGAVPATLAVCLVTLSGWSYWVAVPLALVVAVVLGALVELVVIRRFARAPRLILMVATIGLAQLLAGIAQGIPGLFGASFPPFALTAPFDFRFEIHPFVFHANELITVIVTIAVIGALFGFLHHTNLGVALRACADRSDRASLLGIDVGRTQNVAWIITTVIAAIAMILRAGTLGLPSGSVFGPSLLLRALAAAVIGRMEHLGVIFVAACGIGIVETAVLWNEGSATLIDPVLFVIVLGALLVQRRRREPPQEAQLTSTWDDAARCGPSRASWCASPRCACAAALLRVLVVVGVIALPVFLDLRSTNLAAAVLIYCIIAVSLVLLTGWAGEISLGQVAFVAIGSAAAGRGERALGPRPHRVRAARRRVSARSHRWSSGCPRFASAACSSASPRSRSRWRRRRGCSTADAFDSSPTSSSIASERGTIATPFGDVDISLGARVLLRVRGRSGRRAPRGARVSSARGCSATSSRPATTTGTRQAFGLSPATARACSRSRCRDSSRRSRAGCSCCTSRPSASRSSPRWRACARSPWSWSAASGRFRAPSSGPSS